MTEQDMDEFARCVKRDIDIAAEYVEGPSTYHRYGGIIDEAVNMVSWMQLIVPRYSEAEAARKELLEWLTNEQEILNSWARETNYRYTGRSKFKDIRKYKKENKD